MTLSSLLSAGAQQGKLVGPLWFILVSLLLFGISACSKGNAKIQLTPEDVANLKNVSHIYIVDCPSPESLWTVTTSSLPLPNPVLVKG